VTLFIPAPEFVHEDYLWMLRHSPASTRVVLVEPSQRQLYEAVPLIARGNTRWATEVSSPGSECTLTTAGPAAVTRSRYGPVRIRGETVKAEVCYDNGLVAVDFRDVKFVVAGSADPFRSDRLPEHDNAKLAVDLLSAKHNLVWLDLHTRDPKPRSYSEATPGPGAPIPSLAPGHERERPDASPKPTPSRQPERERDRGEDVGEGELPPPPDPFPRWLVPSVILLLIAGIAVALARGRRLGPPVTEPLPIEVRGAETAIGRSHLYRRAKARGAALETLRIEARRRLGTFLKTGPDRERLLDALAPYGHDRQWLEELLYGPAPENDAELQTRTTELLRLVQQVTREKP
jgi:hypothetical protein